MELSVPLGYSQVEDKNDKLTLISSAGYLDGSLQ